MQTVLVTGGLGYIGSHTVVELIENNYKVVVVDNLYNAHLSVLDGIEKTTGKRPIFYNQDIADANQLDKIFKEHAIESVIHFAAYKAVGESVKEPLKYYKNNVGGLIALIEAMQANKVNSIVFSSSCTVYGQPEEVPVSEQSPILPATSPYGNTKQIGEAILRDCNFLKTVSLRYFNPIGAHSMAYIGELPIGVPNNLVPYITQTAAGIRETLFVHGNTYNTPDGTCIRDYIHVVDLAKAHVSALRYLEGMQNSFEVFNIGTGNGHSVLEVIRSFEDVNKIKLNYHIGPKREGDVESVYADCAKANKELKWKAELSLSEMLQSAWKWQCTLNPKSTL